MEMTKNENIRKIAWALLIASIASTVAYILLSIVIGITEAFTVSNYSGVVSDWVYNLSMGLIRIVEAVLFCLIFRKSTFQEFKTEKLNIIKVFPLLILTVFYAFAMGQNGGSDLSPAAIFRILIVAPIFEELMFRGAIQRTLEKIGGNKFAIMLTTFLFACYHMNAPQFLYTIPLGILAGYAASKYSLKAAMLLHFVCNFAQYCFTLSPGLSATIFTVAMVGTFIVLILKRKKIIAFVKEKPEKGAYKRAIFNCPMILFLILWMFCMFGS